MVKIWSGYLSSPEEPHHGLKKSRDGETFFELNICDFQPELTDKNIERSNPGQVIKELKKLQQLFAEIYTAYEFCNDGTGLDVILLQFN